MGRLLAIEIENFQCIKERTRIEFSPLTFFFGPNSAGKSAVIDAMDFLKVFLSSKDNSKEIEKLIKKWKRYNSEGPLFISVEIDTSTFGKWSLDDIDALPKGIREGSHNAFNTAYGSKNIRDAEEETFKHELALLFEQPLRIELSIGRESDMGFEFTLAIYAFSCLIAIVYRTSKKRLTLETKNIYGKRSSKVLRVNSQKHIETLLFDIGTKVIFSCPLGQTHKSSSECLGYAPSNLNSISAKFANSTSYFRRLMYYVELVAQITLPTEKSSAGNRNGFEELDNTIQFKFPFTVIGPLKESKQNFISLHQNVFMVECWKFLFSTSEEVKSSGVEWPNSVDKLNEIMDTFLFLDNYYQIRSETHFKLTPSEIENLIDDKRNIPEQFVGEVKLYLVNEKNERFKFADVGDGISFVLPIIHDSMFHGLGNVALQQPELHLHPALQSQLGDIFIKDLGSKSFTMMIETHSEHIMLRVLRRIHETTLGKNKLNPVTKDDVAVYFFDPNLNSGTIITKQEITSDGDFLYDWPRGFFSERDQDLFYDR